MRGTAQGRRLFGGCLLGGLGVGAVAAGGAAFLFDHDAPYEPCGPFDQQLCKRLHVAGFDLDSSLHAAAVIGPIAGLLSFVVIVIAVLYTADTAHRDHG